MHIPELEEHAARIDQILDEEETPFPRTVEIGLKKLDDDCICSKSRAGQRCGHMTQLDEAMSFTDLRVKRPPQLIPSDRKLSAKKYLGSTTHTACRSTSSRTSLRDSGI